MSKRRPLARHWLAGLTCMTLATGSVLAPSWAGAASPHTLEPTPTLAPATALTPSSAPTLSPILAQASAPAPAPAATPRRVRGTITSYQPPMLVVQLDNRLMMTIDLASDVNVSTVRNVALADIKPGAYVGAAAKPAGADGKMVALEVLVFPETMRGANEGHYPWDLLPESTMTNATVDSTVQATDGQELKLAYKDGTKVIVVPPITPVVTFAPASLADLLPGKRVFVVAVPAGDQRFTSRRVVVEKDGVAPPM